MCADARDHAVSHGRAARKHRPPCKSSRAQRSMASAETVVLTSPTRLRRLLDATDCEHLDSAASFDSDCDVSKVSGVVDCNSHPGTQCPVKSATNSLRRMGDSGKLPTSAWLHLWKSGRLYRSVADVCGLEANPARRADLLVARFAQVHRFGRKLATLFVTTLSTPALAPGLTPWFPSVDGSSLVVLDTHVGRAIDVLRSPHDHHTYEARSQWLTKQATRIDLREFSANAPSHSPRLIQQSLYAFGSRSNRTARHDPCAGRRTPCATCVRCLCPFAK